MATAGTYVEEMIQYWGNIGRVFTTRLQKASSDARKGEYGFNRLFSDGMALWAEGFDAWCSAWLGRGAEPPAIVFLRVPGKTEFKLRQTRVPIPGDGPPEYTELVRVGGAGAPIPKEHVKVEVTELRDELTVKLIDLPKLHPQPADGQYLGLVHIGERPIAVVHALVTH